MKLKHILSLVVMFFSSLMMSAQEGMSVKSFDEMPNDLDARVAYPKNDQNGVKCALVKIVTTEGDFTFDNGYLGVIAAVHKPELSEWWVYLPEKTRKLKIMHPVYGQLTDGEAGFFYFPNALKSATCYRMELTTQRKVVTYEPTKVKMGFLVLKSEPSNGQVFLTENGVENFVGTTTFQKKLPYGTYNYRIKKSLYHDAVGEVVVDGAKVNKTIVLNPAFGSLKVVTNPSGATVTIDGDERTFTTPCTIDKLLSGKYNVNILASQYASQQHIVTIKDNEQTPLDVTLDARFAQVTINTLSNAKIVINGEQRGVGGFEGELGEGIYDVEVSLAQHRSVSRQIEVVAKQPQTITLNPTPIYGSLDVISDPIDAEVKINGKSYGTTPTTIENLLIGDYEVVLSKDGCATQSRRVTITENNLSTLEVTLPPGREMTIRSDANGDEVYVDGVKMGVTPLVANLSFGTHKVELRRGGKTVSKQINVSTTGGSNEIRFGFSLIPQWASNVTPEQKRVLEKLVNDMVKVSGGTFIMGATSEQGFDAESEEKPTHQVTLSDYYIGKYEVTQEQWKAVMGSNPSEYIGANKPVECVSWHDCQEFVERLNKLTGLKFRLPTEAEWEYAARGGNKSKGYKYSGSNSVGDVAWYYDNSSSMTHPVGTKAPNELGIYDMSGNAWEWCSDWYGRYSSSSQSNPTGPTSGSFRVYRGGSWNYYAQRCRVSNRHFGPAGRNNGLGLRLVSSSL